MNRIEYLTLKKETKQKGLMIKEAKKESRNLDREYNLNSKLYPEMLKARRDYEKQKFDYRANHIFLSLVRGKERVQIENNFDSTFIYGLELKLKDLATFYDYKFQTNGKQQVIGLISNIVESEVELVSVE